MVDVQTSVIHNDLSVDEITIIPSRDMAFKMISSDASLTGMGLDQSQETITGAVYVSSSTWWGQLVDFGGETRHINAYMLWVGRRGMPTDPLYMGISDVNSLQNVFIHVVELHADALAEEDTLYWFGASFEDSPVAIYGAYKPVLACISDDDQNDGDYWMWGFSNLNPYDGQYDFRLYDASSDSWVNHEANWDGAFLVYTEEADISEPIIGISVSFDTVLQNIGFISLIGACLSGVKYGLVTGAI